MNIVRLIRICPVIAILFLLLLVLPPKGFTKLSGEERDRYLSIATVWEQSNISAKDLYLGPGNDISVPPEKEVSCHYVEERETTGATPKFKCRLLDSGKVIRIKFSRRETFAEVAGTRLLWALGFLTDEVYPVRIRCYGCPAINPAAPSKDEPRIERLIEDALMERSFPGEEMGKFRDQGWNWEEVDRTDRKGGASRAQLEALKLLMVFIQHTDSKPSNQRLGCYTKDIVWQGAQPRCRRPVLMVQDLGATFGIGYDEVNAFSALYFKGWSKVSIWNRAKELDYQRDHPGNVCFGQLTSIEHGLFHPRISEEGRQFLANLLNQVSEEQILGLFRAARADKTEELIEENGNMVPVTLQDWVVAFKKKRDEINQRKCD